MLFTQKDLYLLNYTRLLCIVHTFPRFIDFVNINLLAVSETNVSYSMLDVLSCRLHEHLLQKFRHLVLYK